MADAKKRIILYQEKTTVDNSDYVLTDSSANGTKKYQVTRILTEAEATAQAKVDAEAAAREAADNELKADLTSISDGGFWIQQSGLEQGSYNSAGQTTPSTTRIRTIGYIPVEKGGVIAFTPGANAQNIFYGKFNESKSFITDGAWTSSDINIDWDGYVILVFRTATNSAITPSDYDAETVVKTKTQGISASITRFAESKNPMNPLLFDKMYFRKGAAISGTEYLTQYDNPRFGNDQFAELNQATASGSGSGYLAFGINDLHLPKVLTSGESLSFYAIVKSNKSLTFTPRLSSSTTWAPSYHVAVANPISLRVGYNCVKMDFVFDHAGTLGAEYYRYIVLEGDTVFSDLEAEFVFVNGDAFLGWVEMAGAESESYDTDLLFWGDSLTAGAGGGNTSFPKVCSETLGLSRLNCGVGGESANTIAARQGGNNVIIPAGAVNGNYPILDGFADLFGGVVQPLLQGDGAASAKKITINGIECNIANSSGNYVISGYTGEETSVPSIGTFKGSGYTGKVVIIFVGQNGATFTGLTDYNARMAIIDSMVGHIGHNRYVILGLSTGTNTSREADDNAMLARYGNKFFPTRKMLVEQGLTIAGLTPTTQDQTDIAAGTVPTSLRSDGVHLNASGYTALGKMVAEKIKSLGYLI